MKPLLMTPDQIVNRYMSGYCDALAFVLSNILSKPVGILYAVREGHQLIKDPLHVFVILDSDTVLDVKGQRSRDEMKSDFAEFTKLLKHSETEELGHHYAELDDADELYEELNFDPSWIKKAELDLANGLWDRLVFDGKPHLDAKKIPGSNRHKDFGSDSSYGF